MKYNIFPKIVLLIQPSRAKRKAGHPQLELEDVEKIDLREIGISWKDVKRKALN
jgi:hypothetical protein